MFAVLARASEIHNLAEGTYIQWVRQMLTLATGAMTALIALQDNFAPSQAGTALFLLWASWVFLALAIVNCAVILHGESHMYRHAAIEKVQTLQASDPVSGGSPHWLAEKARKTLPLTLVTALVLLCSFAIANSFPSKSSGAEEPIHTSRMAE